MCCRKLRLAGLADDFSYYSAGYSPLELKDYADGYIWLGPLESYCDPVPLDALGGEKDLRLIMGSIDHYFPPDRWPERNEKLKKIYSGGDLSAFVAREGLSAGDFSMMLDRRGLERRRGQ